MVSIKEAAESAVAFARETLGEDVTKDLRLEEVESTTEAWMITLSMVDPYPSFFPVRRMYKTFTVLKNDGQVTKMKIRELAHV